MLEFYGLCVWPPNYHPLLLVMHWEWQGTKAASQGFAALPSTLPWHPLDWWRAQPHSIVFALSHIHTH
jgi:hypothetical protein